VNIAKLVEIRCIVRRVSSHSETNFGDTVEIAVIIPFRGEICDLSAAVNSVRLSSIKNYRIIVIDDRPEVIQRPTFLDESEYFRTHGQGLAKVIEFSKSHITENYVALLAGDDLMSPDRLQLQFTEIQRNNSEICLSGMRKFSSNNSDIEMLIGKPFIETFSKMWLLLGAYGADGTIFMTSDFYKSKYVLDESDSYSDWTIALANYPMAIAYVPKDLVLYRQHANQTTRNGRNDFLQSSVYLAWVRVYQDFFKLSPPKESFLIMCAPWYRSKIKPKDIRESEIFISKVIARFRHDNFRPAEIYSLESLILRRYLFRVNLQNILSVIYVLTKLEIKHSFCRFLMEAAKIAKVLIFQKDVSPRSVKLAKCSH
jgi:glycosyltransferase involved in cell wall biosynthesis